MASFRNSKKMTGVCIHEMAKIRTVEKGVAEFISRRVREKNPGALQKGENMTDEEIQLKLDLGLITGLDAECWRAILRDKAKEEMGNAPKA